VFHAQFRRMAGMLTHSLNSENTMGIYRLLNYTT